MKLNKFEPFLLAGLFFLLCTFYAGAQNITGAWLTENGLGKVEIYELKGEFWGKLIWVKEQTEQAQKVVGTMVLKNLVRQKDGTYKGTVFDPETNKNYKATVRLKNENKIELYASLGFSLFGKTIYWERITAD
ncbi:MAG: DUF2147 domain-containing protein [Prevotellaceae bacterium]|jgi:uncharacterized protein (DUF2147 family)|nr:DUF2147 domain-containing protein [Prevotellaceae bacterium]